MNVADLTRPEDGTYLKPVPPGTDHQAYIQAQAKLALTGQRRDRYGALPGRDPVVVAQLNAETTQAQADCNAARLALSPVPKEQ